MKVARLVLVLALSAALGYLLGACGSGSGVPSFSGEVPSGALPDVTFTGPEVTVPTLPSLPTVPTRPETTTEAPGDTTTRPEPTTAQTPTTTRIETTTVVETVTAPSTPTTTAGETGESGDQTVAVEPASSESSTPWGWIILALGLLAAGVTLAIVTWRRRRGAS